MGHDRGCYCGREPYEYRDCERPNCHRRERALETKVKREGPKLKARLKYINPTSNGLLILQDDEGRDIAALSIISLNGVNFKETTYTERCKEIYDILIKAIEAT